MYVTRQRKKKEREKNEKPAATNKLTDSFVPNSLVPVYSVAPYVPKQHCDGSHPQLLS